jgi:hypothetical protein
MTMSREKMVITINLRLNFLINLYDAASKNMKVLLLKLTHIEFLSGIYSTAKITLAHGISFSCFILYPL